MSSIDDRVFLLSRRWPHHANHSGYDRLGEFVGQPMVAEPVSTTLLPDPIYRRLIRGMPVYDRTSIGLEFQAARHMATHRNCLYHILYGDNCYNYLGHLNGWRGHRIIASYHHPPGKFAEAVRRPEQLERLTAAIIVGRNQRATFAEILSPEQIFFISHPVDTAFYTPPGDFLNREENLCLFVGAHLRDFATLRSVIENAYIVAPELRFIVVLHPRHLDKLNGVVGNFTVLSDISENELLDLYRRATLLIQPLLDCTANNVMLESMSCGLPMVVTDVGAVHDYVDEDFVRFVPAFDAEAMLASITCLLNQPEKRRRMSTSARSRASEFDWNLIAQQMRALYERVLCQS